MESKQVLVIGLGEIGRPLFEVMSEKYPDTRGIDIASVDSDGPVGLMLICYPFKIPGGYIETTAAYVEKFDPEVVVINSTVEPGTTRMIEKRIARPCVFSPVRGKHTRMRSELTHYCKWVAGSDAKVAGRVRDHFVAVGMPSQTMANPETLELAKLLETTYFGVLIAWAQEMDRFAGHVGADYFEMVRFFEEIGYLPGHVFLPGHIGGHCVMPNIDILKTRFVSPLLDAVVESNNRKAVELSNQLQSDERLQPLPMQGRDGVGR